MSSARRLYLASCRTVAASEFDQALMTGSWRRLVFACPRIEQGSVEKAA
ncbi:hypothetical protein OG407_49830 [Streptomyces sp. NBC_01515]